MEIMVRIQITRLPLPFSHLTLLPLFLINILSLFLSAFYKYIFSLPFHMQPFSFFSISFHPYVVAANGKTSRRGGARKGERHLSFFLMFNHKKLLANGKMEIQSFSLNGVVQRRVAGGVDDVSLGPVFEKNL